jgi:lantibiotic modifying enzyme
LEFETKISSSRGCIQTGEISRNIPMESVNFIKQRLDDETFQNDTLCCGSLGCIETLIVGKLDDANLYADKIMNRFATSRINISPENVGLFQGIGGAVYTLLRIIERDTLPAVTLLEIPKYT